MQKLVAGSMEMEINGAYGALDKLNGSAVDSVRVSLPCDITGEQIIALLENPWNIYAEDGTFIGTHTGYNYVAEYSLKLFKVPDEALLMTELQKAAEEITAARKLADERARQTQAIQQNMALLDQQMQTIMEVLQAAGIDINALIQAQIQAAQQAM